jgi:cold shock CspA family protein
MGGKVKWFSIDKGYGFITGFDGIDRYFSVQDVNGANLPGNGDSVSFKHLAGKKGPRATSITITAKAIGISAGQRTDDRVTCSHCNRKMVPRIITKRGSLHESVCPFCGGTYKSFSLFSILIGIFFKFLLNRRN